MKNKKSNNYFSATEKAMIRQAVVDAESRTSGEIATMIVDQSDSYREAEILGAVLFSGFLSIIVAIVIHHVTIWSYVPLVFVLFFPSRYLFSNFPKLKLSFVSRKRIVEAVRGRAVRAFYEKGLYRTREETGVLIFISLLERKVWMLGDKGINARIHSHFWHGLARELAQGIKEDKAAEAMCSVISACGDELARHFPRNEDDMNELPDEVMS